MSAAGPHQGARLLFSEGERDAATATSLEEESS